MLRVRKPSAVDPGRQLAQGGGACGIEPEKLGYRRAFGWVYVDAAPVLRVAKALPPALSIVGPAGLITEWDAAGMFSFLCPLAQPISFSQNTVGYYYTLHLRYRFVDLTNFGIAVQALYIELFGIAI